mmetsp:Transcript_68560/g.108803  ORF Transcript_68560/g.108803 Transcript_68560/m.108803 type:complete len:177 (-) Transcript_68560:18-548(-)|eukprot:CAMPEP_0169131980 /NCGR_PEP_ID=MMETSP1015-20121227/38545_1 /TAXON_ID=342587 /ORGANISM="Karlodinium micrum, Strain CCMP2283" /LENGTH=176 /DNA_ID=CAMNT_0009196295 /DNA_START=51 /DNA_END=581 /DNA_ORIENTATION=-
MFQCRMCSENPLAVLFGSGSTKVSDSQERKNKSKKVSKRNEADFRARSEEECEAIMKQWEQYVHPRAREFFTKPEELREVLGKLAKGTSAGTDPVLGPEEQPVYWYGDVTKEGEAAIRMVKPGEPQESITYVNRVLAFIFATSDSFEQLMKLPKEPFKMSCGDQLNVHLAYISMAV